MSEAITRRRLVAGGAASVAGAAVAAAGHVSRGSEPRPEPAATGGQIDPQTPCRTFDELWPEDLPATPEPHHSRAVHVFFEIIQHWRTAGGGDADRPTKDQLTQHLKKVTLGQAGPVGAVPGAATPAGSRYREFWRKLRCTAKAWFGLLSPVDRPAGGTCRICCSATPATQPTRPATQPASKAQDRTMIDGLTPPERQVVAQVILTLDD